MDVQQWIPMDFQFFEIQFFEKTKKTYAKIMKNQEKTKKNHEKPWTDCAEDDQDFGIGLY